MIAVHCQLRQICKSQQIRFRDPLEAATVDRHGFQVREESIVEAPINYFVEWDLIQDDILCFFAVMCFDKSARLIV